MKKTNPIVPYLITFSMGILLIFFMSLIGVDQKADIAKQNEEGENGEEVSTDDFDPAEFAQGKCISCHGGNFEGGVGPALAGTSLSADEIADVITNGADGMPAGLVPAANMDEFVEYILSLGADGEPAATEEDAEEEPEATEEEPAEEPAEEEETATADAGKYESMTSSCIGCHGGNLEGGVGPALVGTSLSADEIKDVIKNGAPGMPGGMIADEDLDGFAEYILSLK